MSVACTWRTPGFRPIAELLPAVVAGILRARSDASKPSSDAACSPIRSSPASAPVAVSTACSGRCQCCSNQPAEALPGALTARKPSGGLR